MAKRTCSVNRLQRHKATLSRAFRAERKGKPLTKAQARAKKDWLACKSYTREPKARKRRR